ncbi:MAG: hypothetical protein AAGF28_00940 [Pseudomonadota bacterium]
MTKVTVLFSSEFVRKHDKISFDSALFGSQFEPNIIFESNDPDTNDSELRRYYSAEVENPAKAQKLIDALLQLPDVEAAWVKPLDEPPN